MSYKTIRGLPGRVFVLDETAAGGKKHNCPDCAVCQWCSDARCAVCLKRRAGLCCKKASHSRRRKG